MKSALREENKSVIADPTTEATLAKAAVASKQGAREQDGMAGVGGVGGVGGGKGEKGGMGGMVGSGAGGGGGGGGRRLGRGLSALIGPAVPITAPQLTSTRSPHTAGSAADESLQRSAKGPAEQIQVPGFQGGTKNSHQENNNQMSGVLSTGVAGAKSSNQKTTENKEAGAEVEREVGGKVGGKVGGEMGGRGDERGRLVQIGVDEIVPSPFQPRKNFYESGLIELAKSIKSSGLIQPIVVRAIPQEDVLRSPGITDIGLTRTDNKKRYELIAGERRWRAAKFAELRTVPAIMMEADDQEAAGWALVENLQREDLTIMERAEAVRGMAERFGLTHEILAEQLGISRTSVTNLIRLCDLEESIRVLLQDGNISAGHGKVLLGCPPGFRREHLAEQAYLEDWSVRRLEQEIENGAGEIQEPKDHALIEIKPKGGRNRLTHVEDLERQLSEHLGTKVKIRTGRNGKSGSLTLSFYDLDHFDGLMSKIGFVLK